MPRYILTGTPGAGKTAVLRQLEVNGYLVVEEAATDTIALAHALGHDEPSRDTAFIDKIVTLQQLRQNRAPTLATTTVFFDRSPVCTLALCHYLGRAPSRLLTAEVDRIMVDGVYQPTVFFIRNQGFVRHTAARRISFADSLVFEQCHERVYRDLGFHLIDIPVGPLAKRVALVQRAVE